MMDLIDLDHGDRNTRNNDYLFDISNRLIFFRGIRTLIYFLRNCNIFLTQIVTYLINIMCYITLIDSTSDKKLHKMASTKHERLTIGFITSQLTIEYGCVFFRSWH